MVTENLNHAQLQLLDEIVGKTAISCENLDQRRLLSGVLSFIRTHDNYNSDSRIYKVELSETITRIVEIEATSEEEAKEKVRRQYEDGDLTLDISDFLDSNVEILK